MTTQINPEAYYPVIYTVNQSGEKVFKPQYIQGKDLTEPQINYLQSVGYQEQFCQINTQNSDKKELPEGLHEYLYGVIDEAKEALKNEPSTYTQSAIFMLARKDLAEMILLRLPDLKTKQQ